MVFKPFLLVKTILSARINAHVFIQIPMPGRGSVRLDYSQDISGESNGNTAEVQVFRNFRSKYGFSFKPAIGLKWYDSDTFQYLFTYQKENKVQSFVNPYFSMTAIAPLTRKLAFVGNVTGYQLDSALSDLQEVDKQFQYRTQISLMYLIF